VGGGPIGTDRASGRTNGANVSQRSGGEAAARVAAGAMTTGAAGEGSTGAGQGAPAGRASGPSPARRPEERDKAGEVGTSTGPGGSREIPRELFPGGWHRSTWLWLLVFLALNALLGPCLAPAPAERVTVPYTVFKEQVATGNVADVTSRGDAIQGTFKQPVTVPVPDQPGKTATGAKFASQKPTFEDPALMPLLEGHGVVVNAQPIDEGGAWWLTLVVSVGPALLLFGALYWLSTRAAGGQAGAFGVGKSRARRYGRAQRPAVTFADVAGIDEAREELAEVVDFLRNPPKYLRLGGTIPKGVLLVGAPGTGKTLLARAVAGEAEVPFFEMSASEFVELFVGVGASRVRDLFEQAKKVAPAIVFIDELDAIGRSRGAASALAGHDEREQTLNQLLVEMDGFETRQAAVIVLAATNRPDVLDQALLRAGRFDRRVAIQRPDRPGREKILAVHTRGVPLAPDVSLADLAAATPGLVGAELRNLVNEAALRAARKGEDGVGREDFAEAMERIMLGAARHIAVSPEDRRRVAYHEAGHALVGLALPGSDPVRKVTIVPRGEALGATYQIPVDDRQSYPRDYLLARITGALAGRAAELVVFGDLTTGAENDLKQVTEIALRMVTRWGMSEEVGPLALEGVASDTYLGLELGRPRWYGEQVSEAADRAVRRIVDDCHARATAVLTRERPGLDAVAGALLARESLDEAELGALLRQAPAQAPGSHEQGTPHPGPANAARPAAERAPAGLS
jgi:cell division protease FtsH